MDKKIRFVKELIVDGDEKFLEYDYKSVCSTKTFRYQNTIGRLLRLSHKSHNLLYYLVDYMDKDNVVYSNSQFKNRFNNLIFGAMKEQYISEGFSVEEAEKKANTHKYSDVSIRKAYSELKSHNLIIQYKDYKGNEKRGVYWVNPEFFWKDTEKNRDEQIRKILQIESGAEKMIITAKHNQGVIGEVFKNMVKESKTNK